MKSSKPDFAMAVICGNRWGGDRYELGLALDLPDALALASRFAFIVV